MTGTSQATPRISAAIALLWTRFPDRSVHELEQLLIERCSRHVVTTIERRLSDSPTVRLSELTEERLDMSLPSCSKGVLVHEESARNISDVATLYHIHDETLITKIDAPIPHLWRIDLEPSLLQRAPSHHELEQSRQQSV